MKHSLAAGSVEHVDVVIVGAGISGIGTAWHLQDKCPDRSFVLLEGRERIGGTWDLFKYPGIRSDSDMYTLGYSFRPWTEAKAIADAPAILNYLNETAREAGIDRKIRFRHKVKSAAWDSATARWTVQAEVGDEATPVTFTCNFLMMCSGYYSYESGYTPHFEGTESFAGQIIHPQKWPENLDYEGKNVVVIGSGATAVTVVPEMAKKAAKVTMLQRSPTYVVARPAEDPVANWLRAKLPSKLAYTLTRWKNVLMGMYFFRVCQKTPEKARDLILNGVKEQLGEDYTARHFTPRYNPWDQRLCLVPNGDLFEAIKAGKADVVTGHIDRFTEKGIQLTSGEILDADIVVTATGLNLQLLGGMELTVDGEKPVLADRLIYRGMMVSDVPNMAFCFGYTNASWTLKVDLTCEYVCRLLNHMKLNGYARCTPRLDEPMTETEPFLDLASGYAMRGNEVLPKQGTRAPWKLHQNYALDIVNFRFAKLDDGVMQFDRLSARPPAPPMKEAA